MSGEGVSKLRIFGIALLVRDGLVLMLDLVAVFSCASRSRADNEHDKPEARRKLLGDSQEHERIDVGMQVRALVFRP